MYPYRLPCLHIIEVFLLIQLDLEWHVFVVFYRCWTGIDSCFKSLIFANMDVLLHFLIRVHSFDDDEDNSNLFDSPCWSFLNLLQRRECRTQTKVRGRGSEWVKECVCTCQHMQPHEHQYVQLCDCSN